MKGIIIGKNSFNRITVAFLYNPLFVQKIKNIKGHRWHPAEKYWSFPNTDGTLEKILKIFEGEEIFVDLSLQPQLSTSTITRNPELKKATASRLSLRGTKCRSNLIPSVQSPLEDLRRELISRKYSYKTMKSYLYYNRDFLKFTRKNASDINEGDIKNYLLYLVEEKQSATSTLNQAINALKFYYGSMLKKKFVYEVKRPRKDKKCYRLRLNVFNRRLMKSIMGKRRTMEDGRIYGDYNDVHILAIGLASERCFSL